MFKILNVKKYFLLIFFISIFSLIYAIYVEFILSHKPCKLCIYQRIPYVIAIFICFFGLALKKKLFWLSFLTLTFAVSALISGYHVGIENSIFMEFSGCSNTNTGLINKKDILESLKNIIPSCKEVNFKILGLSLATINLLMSIVITFITARLYLYEKNRSN